MAGCQEKTLKVMKYQAFRWGVGGNYFGEGDEEKIDTYEGGCYITRESINLEK